MDTTQPANIDPQDVQMTTPSNIPETLVVILFDHPGDVLICRPGTS